MNQATERLYDQVLVLRCQVGDERAFAEFVQRHHNRLRYYVRRLIGTTESPDDVLQDVWLTVFRELPRLREVRAWKVWVYRIARSRALLAMRRRSSTMSLAEDPVAPADGGADTDANEEFRPHDAAQIHAALGRLSPAHRDVLVLRFLEDMSYEQIAEVVGCPVGTVRSRLYHAKRALRSAMGG